MESFKTSNDVEIEENDDNDHTVNLSDVEGHEVIDKEDEG